MISVNNPLQSRSDSHFIQSHSGDNHDLIEVEPEDDPSSSSPVQDSAATTIQNQNSSDSMPGSSTSSSNTNVNNNQRNPVFALIEKINSVIYGTNVTKCIQNPRQDLEESKQDFQDMESNTSTSFRRYFKLNEDGCLEVINDFIMRQDKLIMNHKVKEVSKSILAGKDFWNISLPVKVFEPKSTLEKIAEELIYAPNILEDAGLLTDPVAQMKAVVTFWIASLHTQIHAQKQFAPYAGETFQGVIGGCPVYVEHLSHNPPVSCFQMYGKNFNIYGKYEFWTLSFPGVNKLQKVGFPTIHFKNTGAKIQVQMPLIAHHGKTLGAGTYCFEEKMIFFDYENKMYGEVDFGTETGGLFCSAQKVRKDKIKGGLWHTSKKFADKFQAQASKERVMKLKFKDKKHGAGRIAVLSGSWLGTLEINQEETWKISGNKLFNLNYFDNPLPSDSNYRLDVLYLRGGDEKRAQEELEHLEMISEKDQQKREKHFNKYKN